MINEAFPARRPFQKVIHASLDIGAGEDWTDPGAIHRHPHRHPGMREVRVEVDSRYFVWSVCVVWHFATFRDGVVACGYPWFGRSKPDFRQLQFGWSFSTCHTRRPPRVPLIVGGTRHCTFPLFFCRFFSHTGHWLKWSSVCVYLLLCANNRTRAHTSVIVNNAVDNQVCTSFTEVNSSLGCWGHGESQPWMNIPYLYLRTYQPGEVVGARRCAVNHQLLGHFAVFTKI